MEVLGRIEPEMELHLPAYDLAVAAPSDVHVGLQCVGLPERGSQELYVHLVVEPWMSLAVRKLPSFSYPNSINYLSPQEIENVCHKLHQSEKRNKNENLSIYDFDSYLCWVHTRSFREQCRMCAARMVCNVVYRVSKPVLTYLASF